MYLRAGKVLSKKKKSASNIRILWLLHCKYYPESLRMFPDLKHGPCCTLIFLGFILTVLNASLCVCWGELKQSLVPPHNRFLKVEWQGLLLLCLILILHSFTLINMEEKLQVCFALLPPTAKTTASTLISWLGGSLRALTSWSSAPKLQKRGEEKKRFLSPFKMYIFLSNSAQHVELENPARGNCLRCCHGAVCLPLKFLILTLVTVSCLSIPAPVPWWCVVWQLLPSFTVLKWIDYEQ